MSDSEGPILYVIVVGFHHKKGCQVEYSYPPLVQNSPNECPAGWKYLPTLALPDGSHNFDEDTVYFHLPSLINSKQTIYGISCFRQIPIEKIKNMTSDITRGTVQKSVCVLSKIPLYGQIQVKMSLITHAYFDEGDFSKVSILKDTYHHLNSVLMQNDLEQQMFVGLSARDFILQWKHKAILMFKLLLLEKRVVMFKSPVYPLCSTILTLISLFPEMIEKGLNQSATLRLSRPMSPMPQYSNDSSPESSPHKATNFEENGLKMKSEIMIETPSPEEDNKTLKLNQATEIGCEITENLAVDQKQQDSPGSNDSSNIGEKTNSLQRDSSFDTINDSLQNDMIYLAQLSTESCGFPLQIFTNGMLCLPYLSLPYLDLLTDVNVRGYLVGATNVLFKQKRQLYDILVDIENGRIECQDPELRKLLHLTTEDLRFADFIVKHVSEERQDVFLDGVGWEGGDEWIRTQFKIYLLCLLRTSMLPDGSREIDTFNSSFICAWRDSHNYKIWLSGIKPGILDVNPGHPFAGQLSVADMKLRLAHTMQNTEGGRKLNQAMVSTGRAVATTSKAVGGAISQAKGAFSNWWSNLLVSPDPIQKGVDPTEPDTEVICAEESQPTTPKTTENKNNLIDIPKSINKHSNISNGDIIKTSSENKNNESMLLKDETNHHPGEIHTV